jgi:hypothetical protein
MAQIEFVVNYDASGKVTVQTHVLKLDDTDHVRFVSTDPNVVLHAEGPFPQLKLEKGEEVPVQHVSNPAVRKRALMSAQPQYMFRCGYKVNDKVQTVQQGVGIPPADAT